MAKTTTNKSETNKSEAIRAYLDAHNDAKPKEVVEALTKAGVKGITTGLVSQIKTKRKGGSPDGKSKGNGKIAALEAALNIEKMGGVQKVKDALAKADSDPIVKMLRDAKTLEKALEQVDKSQAILAHLDD
jgi:hypothetical protein